MAERRDTSCGRRVIASPPRHRGVSSSSIRSYPSHSITGSRGYFTNRGSTAASPHIQNTLRGVSTRFE